MKQTPNPDHIRIILLLHELVMKKVIDQTTAKWIYNKGNPAGTDDSFIKETGYIWKQ